MTDEEMIQKKQSQQRRLESSQEAHRQELADGRYVPEHVLKGRRKAVDHLMKKGK